MANLSWPTACSLFRQTLTPSIMTLAMVLSVSCARSSYDDPDEVLTPGTISFPFSYQPESIGRDGRHGDKLVVKSIAGQREYVIELPDEGDNYDIEVPTASFGNQLVNPNKKFKNPSATDRELVDQMPQLSPDAYRQRQQIEEGLGLGEKGGPGQSPSYIMGLAEINDLYRKADLELALVKTNNLIIHYPTSAKLHKMKGTLLIKLRNYPLAQRAWAQAARLDPGDKLLQRGLARLEARIKTEQGSSIAQPTALPKPPPAPAPAAPVPAPAAAPVPAPEPAAAPAPVPEPEPVKAPEPIEEEPIQSTITPQQSGGMTTKGFSDGLAPRNVPDEPRNALLTPTAERDGDDEMEMEDSGLADGNLSNNMTSPVESANPAPTQAAAGNGLFDGNPDTAAEAAPKPPNVWRNN